MYNQRDTKQSLIPYIKNSENISFIIRLTIVSSYQNLWKKKSKFKLDGILYELMSWVNVCAGTLAPNYQLPTESSKQNWKYS